MQVGSQQHLSDTASFILSREVPLVFLHLHPTLYSHILFLSYRTPISGHKCIRAIRTNKLGNYLHMLALTLRRGLYPFTTCLRLSFMLWVYYKIISEWNPNMKLSYRMVDFDTPEIMETIIPEIDIFFNFHGEKSWKR